MKTQVLSPLSGKAAKYLLSIEVDTIVELYKRDFGFSVKNYFKDLSQISLYECIETGYRFYFPFNIMGDAAFYASLQKTGSYYPKWKWENEKALTFINTNDKVLDVGCGEGNFLKALYEKNIKNCCGIDQSSASLVFSHTDNIPIYNETIETFSSKNKETFDLIVCFQILEHITEVHSFMSSCLHALKPGGKLVIAVPNNNPYLYRYDLYHTLNLPPHHAGLWNKDSLAALGTYFQLKILENQIEPISEQVSEYTRIQVVHLSAKNSFFKWLLRSKFMKKLIAKFHYMRKDKIEGRNCLAVFQKTVN